MTKKAGIIFLILVFILTGCGDEMEVTVEETPIYEQGSSSPFTLSITNNDGKATDMDVNATMKMEQMDHGTIEVDFDEKNDGIYEGEIELPMGGKWIADVTMIQDGESYNEIITITVDEK